MLAKKADRYWVVFCVHDDCEAFLEGYVDPRQAPSHSPEWSLSLQTVQHISHALVSVEQEFEFVITLSTEVARFNANTWECMQEWVDSLRSKLREMKLLSPKENLYSKLPEVRPPLAPTRDPTSPLPATPPVPAAIVPGVERVQPTSLQHHHHTPTSATSSQPSSIPPVIPSTSTAPSSLTASSSATHVHPITAMSNTSTQNLMNLLTNPLQAVSSINNQHISSQHLFDAISLASSDLSDGSLDEYSSDLIKRFISSNSPLASPPPNAALASGSASILPVPSGSGSSNLAKPQKPVKENGGASASSASSSLATTFVNNVLADPGTTSLKRTDKKVLVDVKADDFAAAFADSGSDDDADVGNSTGTISSSSSSRSSSSSSSSSTGSTSSSSGRSGSSGGTNRNGAIGEEGGNESSLLSTLAEAAAAAVVPTVAGSQSSNEPITMSSSPFAKRHVHRDDPKKARRKSAHKSDKSSANVTIIQVSNDSSDSESPVKLIASPKPKVRTPKPDLVTKLSNVSTVIADDLGDDNYKSNVQIIPSNVEYDHHHQLVSLQDHQEPSIIASINDRQITTVKVPNLVISGNGSSSNSVSNSVTISSTSVSTVPSTVIAAVATSSTPIKSDSNFGTVTQISVNSSCDRPRTPPQQQQQQHYEQVFLLPSPIQVVNNLDQPSSLQPQPVSSGNSVAAKLNKSKVTLLSKQHRSSSHSEIQLNRVKLLRNGQGNKENQGESGAAGTSGHKNGILPSASSPAVPSSNLSPSKRAPVDKNIYTPQPQRQMLQRGLTEMVISRSTNAVVAGGRDPARGRQAAAQQTADKFRNEINEQRRRSSSTSDAQPESSGNPVMRPPRLNGASRLQSPPQPFRPHHQLINQLDPMNGSNRKMTLREQQVMQLRREMMHPGGVRLQLRRKDCIGSIGLVDAFGAVWVVGWKQKDHPVLYNALHIGDQLISVAGVAISSAAEAHKTIRGAPGLFVELIIRRIPFGRVYAIRRELDGQCLGLIRDGNTATIVDVVPNSLAARHGLPPKAQSCDGLSLTFWVLTEINGRPLNLFFKDNEIRDRLNAVGRDISILVQPADLVTKLKKQLKSLRGHKDFIVQ